MAEMNRPLVFLVDDSQVNLDILQEALCDIYRVRTASDGYVAVDQIKQYQPDLVILDIVMPRIDGIAVYNILKEDSKTMDIPVMFVTAVDDVACKVRLFELGAADYITKPYNIQEIRARVKMHMRQVLKNHSLLQDIEQLTMDMSAQKGEMKVINNKFKSTVINMMLAKSQETGSHLVRTKFYLAALAEGYKENFGKTVDEAVVEAAVMHDIGKIGVPDGILMKPGRLTPEEYEQIKLHTTIGRDILDSDDDIIIEGDVLTYAKEIAYSHHERWDGKGYPENMKGEEIPLSARMMSLADVYDALVNERVYKKAMTHEEAAKIIQEEKAKAFDPLLVEIFMEKQAIFQMITQKYRDEEKQ